MADLRQYKEWEAFRLNLIKETPVPVEDFAEKKERIRRLTHKPEEFFSFYFPHYCKSKPAPFHIKATRRLINNPEWYEVRAWSRELAKSTRAMVEILFLALTGKKKNILLVSNSYDNAERLLAPYKIELENNQRIISDFGEQVNIGHWENGEFIAKCGAAFRALGAGQSPRGSRNESYRPDFINVDDIDTDEDCRNPEIIDKKWKWIEKALIPTRSISNPLTVLFCGNIIAEYCCITEAVKKADKTDIVNIRTNGVSSWPEKNSESQIDRVLSKISYSASQGEYFNTPVTEGKVFKDLTFGKIPNLSKFDFLVLYGDPSPSNSETKKNSYKALWLIGCMGFKFYIIKGFLEQTTNSTFVQWYYDIKGFVKDSALIYNYVENNSLQDPFYKQVFLPLFQVAAKEKGTMIGIIPDDRDKPDKFTRVEGTLEPINRLGYLIFNEDEQTNPHMMRLIEQFKAVSPTSKAHLDGPDAIEGGIWIIQNKLKKLLGILVGNKKRSKNRI